MLKKGQQATFFRPRTVFLTPEKSTKNAPSAEDEMIGLTCPFRAAIETQSYSGQNHAWFSRKILNG